MRNINLKIARVKANKKQREVAKDLDISEMYLRQLENGQAKNPSLNIMRKLASYYNCSLDDLFSSDMQMY
ncbi:helix-turn-helix transcriptional regulator [Anaerosphaera multitolerans]|uniref:XRE family transcriptional regulator n=1 Tax=Anaerosphaera multitolerans TaxID=2487351 RepID=A0A437S6L9_9FIRM|nr:helix-turn-helix transcriptional regulator [Anaerosphaera multitolerans]RVU54650.1 XRE family transcriptional regulator [Anaerosphaera multitolerans]